MANNVFANGREISCKKADGKSICAFPDVCMTPPENPATPPGVPVPYPNTAFAKDTSDGSKEVQISGQEVLLKNKSFFKTSTGNEAGCAAKKGVVTGKIKGKAYFIAWSMDVKVEGENVVRHLDMTTHNHGSPITNTPPIIHLDRLALILSNMGDCEDEIVKIMEKCVPWEEKAVCPSSEGVLKSKGFQEESKSYVKEVLENEYKPSEVKAWKTEAQRIVDVELEYYALEIQDNECLKALSCALTTFNRGKKDCCPHQTPEHLIPAAQFGKNRGEEGTLGYKARHAPTLCATGGKSTATHGLLGAARAEYMDERNIPRDTDEEVWTVRDSAKCGSHAVEEVYKQCRKECIESQLIMGHEDIGINENDRISGKQENVRDLSDFKSAYIGG